MRILVVEDDADARQIASVSIGVRWPDAKIDEAATVFEARSKLSNMIYDAIILDLSLPDGDGLEILRQIDPYSDTALLVLTGRSDDVSLVQALEAGADDLLVKPYSPLVLQARLNAVLRRSSNDRTTGSTTRSIVGLGDEIELNIPKKRVVVGSQQIGLTPLEWELIEFLASEPGRVHGLEAIGLRVWGPAGADAGAIKAVVKRIRAKLMSAGASRDPIVTHRGFGYSIDIADIKSNAA